MTIARVRALRGKGSSLFTATRQSDSFRPTLEGDPTLDRRVDSQAWASNAFGETQAHSAKKAAERALLQEGLSNKEREELLHVARTGMPKEDANWFFDILDKVTRPGNVVRTAILDITEADQRFGTEIQAKDYWDQLVGNREAIIERHGTDLFGDRGDASGSAVLRALGWEEQESAAGKTARFLAAFGLDIVSDPISYVTFGTAGAGKTAALGAANSAIRTNGMRAIKVLKDDIAEKGLKGLAARKLDDLADPLGNRMLRDVRKAVDEGFEAAAEKEVLRRAGKGADEEVIAAMRAELYADAQFVDDVVDVIATDAIASQANRINQLIAKGQWKTLDTHFPEFMASTSVQNFAKGGMRFTADPIGFFRHKAPTMAVGVRTNSPLRTPAAEALFQRASANPLIGGIFQAFRSVARGVDAPRSLRVAARAGQGFDAWRIQTELVEKRAVLGLGEQLSTNLRHYLGSLGRVARDADFDPREAERLLSGMLGSMPDGHHALIAAAPEAVQEALIEQHGNVRAVLDRLGGLLEELSPSFSMREGYFPLVTDSRVANILKRHLTDDGTMLRMPKPDEMPEDLRVGYELLSEWVGQLQRGNNGSGGVVLGGSKHMQHREFGTAIAFPLDQSVDLSMLDPNAYLQIAQDSLQGSSLSLSWLNEQMGAALDHLLARSNVAPLPQGTRIFNTDVSEVLDGYVAAIEGVIDAHLIVDIAKKVGAAKHGEWAIDAQRAIARVSRDLSPERMTDMRTVWETLEGSLEAVEGRMVRVQLTGTRKDGTFIELPSEIARDPKVRAAVDAFKRQFKENRKRAREIERAQLRAQKLLERKGLPEPLAKRASMAPLGEELDDVIAAIMEVANREATDLVDTVRASVNTYYGNVTARNKLIDDAKQEAAKLVRAARKELDRLLSMKPSAAPSPADLTPQVVEPTPDVLRQLAELADAATAPTPSVMTPSNSTVLSVLSEAGDDDVARVIGANGDAIHDAVFDAFDDLLDIVRFTDDGMSYSFMPDDTDIDVFLDFLAGGRGVTVPAAREGVEEVAEQSIHSALVAAATERGLSSTGDFVRRARSRMQRTVRTQLKTLGVDWDFQGHVRATGVEPPPPNLAAMTDAQIEDWVLDHYDEYVQMMSRATGIPTTRFRKVDDGFVAEGGGRLYVQAEPTRIPPKGKTIRATLSEVRKALGDDKIAGHEALRLADTVRDDLSPAARATLDAIQQGGIEGFEVERFLNLSESIARTTVRNPRGVAREDVSALMHGWTKMSRQLESVMAEPTPARLRALRDTYYGKNQPALRNLLRRSLDADEFARWDQTMGLIELAYDPKIPAHWQEAAEHAAARVSGAHADLLSNPWDDLMAVVTDAEGNALSARSTAVRMMRKIQQRFVETFPEYAARVNPRTGQVELREGAEVFASAEFKQRFRKFADELNETARDMRQVANEVADRELRDLLVEQSKLLARASKVRAGEATVRQGLRPDGLQNIEKFGMQIAGQTDSLDVPLWLGQMIEDSMARMQSLYRPTVVSDFARVARSFHTWWKASVTVGRLGAFLGNNLIGGMWNAWIAGVGPEDVPRIGRQMMKFRNAQRQFKTFDEAIMAVDEWFRPYLRAGVESGVVGGGFAGKDLQRIVDLSGNLSERLLTPKALKFWSVDDWWAFQVGGRGMEVSEDAMRMAVFQKYYDPSDPGSWTVARDAVNMVHFDYGDLTNVERSIQNVIPFWTWTARNIPLQVRTMIEQPRVMARYSYMMGAIDDNWSADEDLFNDWPIPYSTGRAVVVGQMGEGEFASRVIFDPRLPVTDMAELFEGLASPTQWRDYVGGQLGPWFSFAEIDFDDDRVRSRVNAPLGMNEMIRMLSSIGVGDPIVSSQGDVQIPRWVRSSFETAFPTWLYAVEDWAPADPRRQQRAGWSGPDPTLADRATGPAMRQLRSFGFRVSPPTDVASQAAQGRQSVQDILDRMKIEGRYQE